MHLNAAFDWGNYTLTFLGIVTLVCILAILLDLFLRGMVFFVASTINGILNIRNYVKDRTLEDQSEDQYTIDHYTEDNEPVNKYGHVVNSSVGGGFQ